MKIKQLNLVLYLCVGLVAIVNLVSTNALATKGMELSNLYQHSQTLKKTNQQLETEINKYSNLSYIQEIAEDKGFRRINKISVVSTSSLVASKPDTIYP